MRLLAVAFTVASATPAYSAPSELPYEIADVRWNVGSTVFANLACQGKQDTALFGVSERSGFVVAVQPARKGVKPSYLVFAARGRDPMNMRLIVEDLDFHNNDAFKREVQSMAPGLQPSKSCKGLSFGDGETDSHHIYWNRGKKAFSSWSL